MAYREVHCVEIREVIRCWQAGLSQRRIDAGTGVSRRNAASAAAHAVLTGSRDAAPRRRLLADARPRQQDKPERA